MDSEQTRIYLTVLMASLFLIAMLISFILFILWHHRKRLEMYKEKLINEMSILEIERKRMATDIHDDLGPILLTIKMQLDCFTIANKKDIEIKERFSRLIAETIRKIRETSYNLSPAIIERKGLIQALKHFTALINKSGKLKVSIEIKDTAIVIDKDKELHLYRIFQEMITNCTKHSTATELKLLLTKNQRNILFVVTENGQSFEYEKKATEEVSLGLKNIVNRIEIIKGHFFIDSNTNKGVTYTIELPVLNHE